MLPGPLTVQVIVAVELVTENALEPPTGTVAEPGVTASWGVGVGVGVGGGALLPPPPHPMARTARVNEIKSPESFFIAAPSAGKTHAQYWLTGG